MNNKGMENFQTTLDIEEIVWMRNMHVKKHKCSMGKETTRRLFWKNTMTKDS